MAEDEAPGPTAYVGNFPFRITEEDFEEIFKPIPLKSIRLIRDRDHDNRLKGYGFLEFFSEADLDEGVRKNGTDVRGRRLSVQVCRTPPRAAGSGERVESESSRRGVAAGRGRDGYRERPRNPYADHRYGDARRGRDDREDRYSDRRYDERRNDERRNDERRNDERRNDERRYDERWNDQRRYDERPYDERRYDEKRYDERRYDDRRYDDRQVNDRPRYQAISGYGQRVAGAPLRLDAGGRRYDEREPVDFDRELSEYQRRDREPHGNDRDYAGGRSRYHDASRDDRPSYSGRSDYY